MTDQGVQTRDNLVLRDYLKVLRERFWVVPVAVAVVLGITLAVSLTATPQYRASTRMLFQKNNLEQALFGSQVFDNTSQDRQVQTGAVLVQLDPIAQAVKEELKSSRSTSALLDMIDTSSRTTTNIIDITATGPDAAECAAVANSFADQFILARRNADRQTVKDARLLVEDELRALSAEGLRSERGLALEANKDRLRIVEAMQDGGFLVVQRASAPGKPFSPTPFRDGVLAVVLGLVGGVGLAFLLEYIDKALKDDKSLELVLGAPVLARIPLLANNRRGEARDSRNTDMVGFNKRPVLLEAFRTLRSNLEFYAAEKKQTTWLITSSEPQEGKSSTAINLALAMALAGKRVVLIDADLRQPMLHEYVGVEQACGLSNLLAGAKRLEECLQLVKADEFMPPGNRNRKAEGASGLLHRNIYALASGPVPPNPAELLSSQRLPGLLKELSGMCDCVVIDAPPVLAVNDVVIIARYVDGVLVVARLGSTSRDQIHQVREVLERANARVVGAVAFDSKKSSTYGKSRYGYGYGYGRPHSRRHEHTDDGALRPPALPNT